MFLKLRCTETQRKVMSPWNLGEVFLLCCRSMDTWTWTLLSGQQVADGAVFQLVCTTWIGERGSSRDSCPSNTLRQEATRPSWSHSGVASHFFSGWHEETKSKVRAVPRVLGVGARAGWREGCSRCISANYGSRWLSSQCLCSFSLGDTYQPCHSLTRA